MTVFAAFNHPAFMAQEKQLASLHIELAAGAIQGGWIMLFPFTGSAIYGNDGRGPYLLDDMQAVIDASVRVNVDLAIDYDHATDFKPPGEKRLAAGWMKELAARADGIYARVEWTTAALQHLTEKEYRYISPTFLTDKTTGRVLRILRAALTNDPNLEVKALAAAERPPATKKETTTMENETLKAIAELLGLGADATEAAVLEAVQAMKGNLDTVKEEVDAPADATGEEIVDKIEEKIETETAAAKKQLASSAMPDPTKWVPMDGYKALQKQLAAAQTNGDTAKVEASIKKASEEGRLPPSMHEWARNLASTDMAAFDEFMGSAPAVVTAASDAKANGGGRKVAEPVMDEGQKSMSAALGVTPAQFAKTK